MAYFSERNGLRNPIKRTYQITIPMYSLIFDCCKRYFDNMAWKYPLECPDGYGCCGIDTETLYNDLIFEVPDLYKRADGTIVAPRDPWDTFNQYALLDLVEFVANNIKDIKTRDFHKFFSHDHLIFSETNTIIIQFQKDINHIFTKTGLLYHLNSHNEIERIIENGILGEEVEEEVNDIKELGLKELVQEAIRLYKSPLPSDNKTAVEKIWDAFERLKTYFTTLNKRDSANKIIEIVSNGSQEIQALLTTEFKLLTDIGNQYRIRHHETDKIEINDIQHYDYLFNRCLSIITLSLQYLN